MAERIISPCYVLTRRFDNASGAPETSISCFRDLKRWAFLKVYAKFGPVSQVRLRRATALRRMWNCSV